MGGGTGSDSVDGGYDYPAENPDVPENPGEGEGGGNKPTEPEKPENPEPDEQEPEKPNPDEPSASYESESDILKKILTEETYSTYAAESESSLTLTQETIISSADIFLKITALVGTSESIENIQTLVDGAAEHTKKALVAMAEGMISIEKDGMKDVPYKWYYFVYSLSGRKNYGVYKGDGTESVPVYAIRSESNMPVAFSGTFDLSKAMIETDGIEADGNNATLCFSETQSISDAEDSIRNGIQSAIENGGTDEDKANTDNLLADIKLNKAVTSSFIWYAFKTFPLSTISFSMYD